MFSGLQSSYSVRISIRRCGKIFLLQVLCDSLWIRTRIDLIELLHSSLIFDGWRRANPLRVLFLLWILDDCASWWSFMNFWWLYFVVFFYELWTTVLRVGLLWILDDCTSWFFLLRILDDCTSWCSLVNFGRLYFVGFFYEFWMTVLRGVLWILDDCTS